MYGILTTYPADGSRNVGDHLITASAQAFIAEVCTGTAEFTTVFRGGDFSEHIDQLNDAAAIFCPGFGIRDSIDSTYDVLNYLDELEPPLVPLGAGWKSTPGEFRDSLTHSYSQRTSNLLQQVAEDLDSFAVREYYTQNALRNNGIENVVMVGDCGWYHPDSFGEPMKVPDSVDRLVMTTPHSERYKDQAKELADELINLFPDVELICSLHSDPTPHENRIADHCRDRGFDVREVAGEASNIDFYADCDLHVGYRVHGHIAFLRRRLPSVLLHEDGRGAGFSYSFGTGGFNAFRSRQDPVRHPVTRAIDRIGPVQGVRHLLRRRGYPKYAPTPPDEAVVQQVRLFLEEELRNGFLRYRHIPGLIDTTYADRMQPLVDRYVT